MSLADELDTRRIRRFGNLTSVGTAEVLVCGRTYTDPGTQAQRSVVSTSAQDGPAGSGARVVRATWGDSNYNFGFEDIVLNGTTPVNTVSTTMRFIEKFEVVQGAAAAGAIKIMTLVAGGGTEIAGIGSGSLDAYLCHHYVPAGKTAFLLDWYAVASLDTNLKLYMQARTNGSDLVDQIADLYNLIGPGVTMQGRIEFAPRSLSYLALPEKTYTRIIAVPGAAGSVIRTVLNLYQP